MSPIRVEQNISSEICAINSIVAKIQNGKCEPGWPSGKRAFLQVYSVTVVCYGGPGPAMHDEDIKISARAIPSLQIIASGIVFAFLYFASSVVMTLLLAALLAYFLDPVVEFLERMRIPRGLGSLIVLLVVMLLVGGLGLLVANGTDQFVADWPRYSAILGRAVTAVDRQLATVENQVEAIAPGK